MQKLHRDYYLADVLLRNCFCEALLTLEYTTQVAMLTVLKQQEDVLCVLEGEVKLCDEWTVFAKEENVPLRLCVGLHLLLEYLIFIHDFHGEQMLLVRVLSVHQLNQEYTPERPLSKFGFDPKVLERDLALSLVEPPACVISGLEPIGDVD
jgi:hypothetical protein